MTDAYELSLWTDEQIERFEEKILAVGDPEDICDDDWAAWRLAEFVKRHRRLAKAPPK